MVKPLSRKVGVGIGLGIVVVPIVFAWFTLRSGYSKFVRATAFGWLGLLSILVGSELTIFVVPPIGAVPEGRTLVISRLRGGAFFDSADGMCQRNQGRVNMLCRAMVLGGVGNNATIYLGLPYSEALYQLSTNGMKYEN